MIKLGKVQNLIVSKIVNFGAYLREKDSLREILLPKKYIKNLKIKDKVKVFIYKDSEDRLIATTKQPYVCVNDIGYLEVKQITKIGAFLDWGLDKDILLPFKEQTDVVKVGHKYLVKIYIDKSNRIAATMKLYNKLSNPPNIYKKDDIVNCTIYDYKKDFGFFVAIDNKYNSLIPKRECFGDLYVGKVLKCRVIKVYNDGRLVLANRQKIEKQILEDSNLILKLLKNNNGVLNLHEKSDKEEIFKKTKMSKSSFKRAIGNLLKKKYIKIVNNKIYILG